MAGLRVVRGPEWKWGDQDGGEGHVGTVVGKGNQDGWMSILWDNGLKNSYRAGAENCHDLIVLDNGPAGTRHPGVQCDVCSENNIRGTRWKCAICYDYDLCTECYGNDKHDTEHKFVRIDISQGTRQNVGKRKFAVKLQSKGGYKGATVVRGQDWRMSNQDGGEGNVGKVERIGYKREGSEDISCVVVKWPHSSNGYVYCFGWNGRVDVKVKSAAIGWGFYRDHLPVLANTADVVSKQTVPQQSSGNDLGEALARLLTAGLVANEFGTDMGTAMGLTDAVLGQRKTNARKQQTMRMFGPGDKVRLCEDPAKLKQLQEGHGGFNMFMIVHVGKVGVVKSIDDDGDVNVNFGGTDWCLNPAAITKQGATITTASVNKPATATVTALPKSTSNTTTTSYKKGDKVVLNQSEASTKSLQGGHGGWHDAMTKLISSKAIGTVTDVDSDGDLTVDFGSMSFIINPAVCGSASSVSSKHRFNVGDRINMDKDLDFLKRMQQGHGSWNNDMKKSILRVGAVKAVDEDGDLQVDFGDKMWTLNPEVCHMVKSSGSGSGSGPRLPKKHNIDKNDTVESASTSNRPGHPTKKCKFSIGDCVRLDKDVDFVKRMQSGHGGWNNDLKKAMKTTGIVKDIDGDGDIKVDFDDQVWTLNPEVCHIAVSNAGPRVVSSAGPRVVRSASSETAANTRIRDEANVTSASSSKDNNSTPEPATRTSSNTSQSNRKFSVGDQVKLDVTPDRLKVMQRGHGGWNAAMQTAIGQVGIIKDMDSDGDVKVGFTAGTWTFNPDACVPLDASVIKQTSQATQNSSTGNFSVGDRVIIATDVDIVVRSQQGHGGWTSDMQTHAIGKIGTVKEVRPNGDIKVAYGDKCWNFNSDIFSLEEYKECGQKSKDTNADNSKSSESQYQCAICRDKSINVVFNCGHFTCESCSKSIDNCHICRNPIAMRTKLFI